MSPHRIVVLAVVVIIVFIQFASADSKLTIPNLQRKLRVPVKDQYGVPTNRLLEIDGKASKNAEERAFAIPGLGKAKEAITFTTSSFKVGTWLSKGESPDDIAKFLIRNKNVDDVLSNLNFRRLDDYISKFNAKYPKNQVSMIDVLTRRYGEAPVSMMLQVSKSVGSRKEIATRLQIAQIEGWLNGGKSPDDLITILKLDKTIGNPLGSPNFDVVRMYTHAFNQRNTGQQTTLIDAFLRVYGGEEQVLLHIYMAKMSVPNKAAHKAANELQDALFTKWFTENKSMESIREDVFRLSEVGENLLAIPVLRDFRKFCIKAAAH